MSRDPRVDDYIARQADFARPILERLRALFHDSGPEIEETLKWGAPAFLYRGSQLAIVAAFKAHAALSFRHGSMVTGEAEERGEAMGQFGRLTSLEDLPAADEMKAMVRKAAALVDQGIKPPRPKAKAPIEAPDDLVAALRSDAAAAATFEAFTPAARREYVDWVVEAKRPETRAKRIAQAVEWMAEGKKRNWKYERC